MSVSVEINSIIIYLNSTSTKLVKPLYEAIATFLELNSTKIEVELFHDESMSDTVPQNFFKLLQLD